MLDSSPSLPDLQRTRGRARVTFRRRSDRTVLGDLHQSGSAKVFLPRVHRDDPEAVLLNTAGGITGGDRVRYELALEADTSAVASTQTAERAYRSTGAHGEMSVRIDIGPRARLDWLPQETILFDGSRMRRSLDVTMAGDAALVSVETLVLGRAAMGERLSAFELSDHRRIRRGGRLAYWEPLYLDETHLEPAAALAGNRAVATIAFLAPGAEDAAAAVGALRADGVEHGVSGWDGKLIVRALAADALPLKRYLTAVLERLRGVAMPRVWQV